MSSVSNSGYDDIGLVGNEAIPSRLRWLTIFVATFLSVGIADIAYAWRTPVTNSTALTQDVMNQQIVAGYILKGGCDVVLVGSSITYAIREEFFFNPTCNLGLPGEGAATGMALLERFEKTPGVIVVEIDALRHENQELVGMVDVKPAGLRNLILKVKMGPRFTDLLDKRQSGSSSPLTGVKIGAIGGEKFEGDCHQKDRPGFIGWATKAEYAAWASACGHSADVIDIELSGSRAAGQVNKQVQDAGHFQRALPNRQYNGPITKEVQPYFEQFSGFASIMERRGAKVLFVNIPVAGDKDDMTLIMEKFSPGRTVTPKVNIRDLRWVDSTHLDGRSAALYAAALEPYLKVGKH